MAKIAQKGGKNAHRDCEHCSPYTKGFLNEFGEPILGDCDIVPHKVLLNRLTACRQWKRKKR